MTPSTQEFLALGLCEAPDMVAVLGLAVAGELFHDAGETYRLVDGRLSLVSAELSDAASELWDHWFLLEDTTYRALLTDDAEPIAVLEYTITPTGRTLLEHLTTTR